MKTGGKRVRTVALASIAAALTAVAGAAPQAAAEVGPRAAERAALKALDAAGEQPARRVVFRSPRLLTAGAAVHVARLRGGGRPDATGATTGRMPVALRAPRGERAWLFYEDRAPGTLFEHGGRVALVGARSGAVRVSAVIQGPPSVGGELPRFLRSFAGYFAPYYRRVSATTLAAATRSPLATAAARRDAAQRLAADRACLVGTADTLGNFYDYAAVDHSRAAVGKLARELRELAPGVVATRYRRVSGTTLAGYLQGLVDARGCREVSLYLAGGGYRAGGETAVALGVLTRPGGRIQRQLVTGAELRALLRSRPGVWWNLTVDAPHAGALLTALRGEPNLASLQASGRAGDPSHIAGRPGTRSQGSLLFTRGLLDGLRSALADQSSIAQAAADEAGGRAPTFLSALLARGFDAGIGQRPFAGLGVRPQSFTRVGPTGPGGLPPGVGGSVVIDGDQPQPVNQPPAIATGVSETDYPENDPATAIDPALTVTDADSPTLAGATVRIASGHVQGEDELGLAGGGPVSGSWNAASGVLTLTGSASVADYQAALRSITYRNDSDDPAAGPRQVTFRVTDGKAESAPASVDVDVAGANDSPAIGLAAGAAAYVEDATAVAIDPAATVTDPDSAELTEAVVEISSGLQAGEDRLALTAPVSGIATSYDSASGTLTLSGPAPRADYEQALRNVGYANDSDDPDTGTRTVSFEVTDGDGATSAAASRDVTVAAVNDAPVVTAGATELDYAEGDPATAIDTALTVADVDSGQLEGATVTVASGHVEGDDVLAFSDTASIAGSWNAASGVLTLTGSASVADYQAALRSVTYRNASDNPAVGPRSIAFRADDGDDESGAATQTVAVTGDNDAPDLDLPADGDLAYTEDDPVTAIDGGATLTDPDSPTFASATARISAGFAAGEDRLALTAAVDGIAASYDEPTGVLTLTGPASRADFQQALRNVGYRNVSDDPDTATRTVELSAEDGAGADTPARTRDVTVAAVNDAPVVTTTATALAYAEDDPATVLDGGIAVADPDSTTLTGATVRLTGGYVEGEDELSAPASVEIAVDWDAPTGTLTLSGTATVAEYQAALRSVTYRNASDDPATGTRTVTVRVDDCDDLSAAATRSVEVSPANDAPDVTLSGGSASYTENDPATAVDSGLTLTDPDSASIATATVAIAGGFHAGEDSLELTAPVDGIAASYNPTTGVLTLTGPAPLADFQTALRAVGYSNSSDDPDAAARTISFTLTDAGEETGPTRSRTLALTPVNDAPVAAADSDATDADTVLTGAAPGVLGNDSDPESDPLTVVAVEGQGANVGAATATAKGGSVTVEADGSFSYDPSGSATLRALGEGDTDTDTFTYAAGDGSADDTATVTITVTGVADAPDVALAGGSASYTENDPATPIDPSLTVGDPDSTQLASATIEISGGLQAAEDRLELTTPVAGIDASYDQPTGTVTLTGPASLADFQTALRDVGYSNTSDDPDTAARTISFTLTDAEGESGPARTRGLTVTSVNDVPVAAADDIGSTDEATALEVPAPGPLANDDDAEGDTLTVVAVQGSGANVGVAATTAKGASVTVDADGSISYDPSGSATLRALGEGDTDTDTFTYAAGDGSANDTATVTVTVIGLPDPPEATNDSYDGVGNTTLTVGVAGPGGEAFKQLSGSVLDNDSDPDTDHSLLTVEAETVATTLGGSVTIEADGNFTYTPPAGSTATDTFTYTVSDGERTDDGTVSIPLNGRVWYVHNQEPNGGLGRSGDPFDTLAEAVSASSAGDTLYVFKGSGTTTGMNAGAALKANQRLLGETKTLTIGGDTVYTGVPANRPAIGNAAGAGVTLASGSRVEGLQVTAAGGAAIAGGTAAGSTVADVIANGSAGGVSLNGTSGTFDLSDLSIATTGGTGVAATNAGTVQFTAAGTISINSSGGKALDVSGTALGGTIDSVTVPSSTAGGVSLQSTTGSLTFGDLALTTTGGTGFYASGVAGLSVPAAGTATVSSSGGPAIDVRSSSSPNVVFDSASSTNSSGTGFNVESITGGTVSAAAGTISGASGAAVRANGGTGAITYAGAVNDGNGRPADVTGRTGGSVTVSGNITEDDTGINVSGNSGGSTTFSGASKSISTGANDAVFLNNNTGHAVSFTGGGLALTATSGRGFVATGGGTVDVQGSGNTISTGAGTALEVQNTGIGASDLTFRSIASNGGANGIYLNNTTAGTGGLTVTGSGTAESGGVIQGTSGADGSSAGVGAYLNSTRDVSLDRMRFSNHQGHAIRGNAVNGLSLTNSTVNGTNGTNDANDEGSIWLNAMTGTVALTDTAVSGGYEDNIDVFASSGTLTLNLTRVTVGANSLNLGGNGLFLNATGTSNVTTTIDDSDFTSSREDLLQHNVADTATSNFTIKNSSFSNDHANYLGGSAALITTSGNGSGADLTYRLDNNTARDTGGGFWVAKGTGIANARGRINNNRVGVTGVPLSGAKVGSGITVEARGQGTHTTAVTNNQVRQYNQTAYRMIAGEQSVMDNGVVTFNVTATGNLQAEPGASATAGWRMELADPNTGPTVCFDLNTNTLTGGGSIADVRIQNQMDTSIYRMPGYTGGPQDVGAVASYIAGRNTTGGAGEISVSNNTNNSGFNNTVPAGSLCPQPPA